MAIDLVVRGGTIVDGTGSEPYQADVVISDGRITERSEPSDRPTRPHSTRPVFPSPPGSSTSIATRTTPC